MIREQFERDGWALIQRFLTPLHVESLRSATEELAGKGAHLLADAEIDGARYYVQSASGRRGPAMFAHDSESFLPVDRLEHLVPHARKRICGSPRSSSTRTTPS